MFAKASYLEAPYAVVYHQAIEMLKSIKYEGEDTFHRFKKILKTHEDVLPLEDLKALNTLLRNYCIFRQNLGFENFLKEAFTLYQEHLEKGLSILLRQQASLKNSLYNGGIWSKA